MILYNVTINIEKEVEQDWVDWMKETHIPEVMDTGFFTEYRMLKMLSEMENETGNTYAIQYMTETLGNFEKYLDTVASRIQKKSISRYGTKLVAFRTVLEEV